MARCKSCGAEIIFIGMASGKKMPCDPEQVYYTVMKGGPITVVTQNGEVYHARIPENPNEATGLGHISHFATCPDAAQHRKGKAQP